MLECKKIKLHGERIERLKNNPDYYWDEQAGETAIAFFENNIRHYKGEMAGKPFQPSKWQIDYIIKPIFCLKYRSNGNRVFKECYIQLARKNGKSFLASAILLLIMCLDGTGLDLYCAATKKDQAKIVFNDCVNIIKASPELNKRLSIFRSHIEYSGRTNVLSPLSSDKDSLDGLNPACAVIDELHAHKARDVHDVIVSACGARPSHLIFKITTAGNNINGVCHQQYKYSEKVLNGEILDDNFFCFIAEPDKDDAWDSRDAYLKANPNIGESVNEEYLKRELEKAKLNTEDKFRYIKYHLNQWQEASAETWLHINDWNKCSNNHISWDNILTGEHKDTPAYIAVDLSKSTDLSAISVLLLDCEKPHLITRSYLPKKRINEGNGIEAPYKAWLEEEHIVSCGEEIIDYDQIYNDILALADCLNVQAVGFDRAGAAYLINKTRWYGCNSN